MKMSLRIVMWFTGAAWVLSWLVISLEIFRWHHMTPSLHLNPPVPPPGFPPPRPGGFLIGSILLSIITPPTFILLVWLTRAQNKSRE
jgi:hypothetical protein